MKSTLPSSFVSFVIACFLTQENLAAQIPQLPKPLQTPLQGAKMEAVLNNILRENTMKKTLVILLLSLIVGCGESEQTQTQPVSDTAQNQPQPVAEQPSAETETETEAEAIAALEQLGATIGKDENGNIISLSLIGTKITDAGLLRLERLTKLQRLVLDFTKVTDAGVADLQKALPNCKISH